MNNLLHIFIILLFTVEYIKAEYIKGEYIKGEYINNIINGELIKYKIENIPKTVNNITFLIHGIASNSNELYELENELLKHNIYSISIELKNDPITSYIMTMDNQCNEYYNVISNIINDIINNINESKIESKVKHEIESKIENKIEKDVMNVNLLGISQGGLIARCIIERYNNLNININFKTLITLATPNMGIYYDNINININILTFNDYWKNPFNYTKYLHEKKFITFLNNELPHDNYNKYKTNFKQINKYIAIWSNIDDVILPPESGIFNYYNIHNAEKYKILQIENKKNNLWYINDNLGLKYLYDEKKYLEYMFPCKHDTFKLKLCFLDTIYNNTTLLYILINNI